MSFVNLRALVMEVQFGCTLHRRKDRPEVGNRPKRHHLFPASAGPSYASIDWIAAGAAASISSIFSGCLAARFGEVGPAAAAAADDRRDLLHDLAGLDRCRQIGRHRDDDLHLAVVRRGEDDDAALDLRFQRIGEAAQRVLVEVADLARAPA